MSLKESANQVSIKVAMIDSLLANGSSVKKADSLLQGLHKIVVLNNYQAQVPWVFYYESLVTFYNADYINSIIKLQQAVKALDKLPEDANKLQCQTKVFNQIGLCYSDINDWENAQLNYQKALVFALQLKDSSLVAKIYLNTAFIFIDYQDWKNAAVNLYKSLDYITAAGVKDYQASIYSTLVNANIILGNKAEVVKFIQKSDAIFKQYPTTRAGLFNSLCHTENSYFQNNCKEALSYANHSLYYAKALGDSIYIAVALEQNARIERCNKHYAAASNYLAEAIAIADRNHYLGVQNLVYYEKMFLLKEIGDFKEAFETSVKLIALTDSLTLTMNNNRRIINDAAFEAEQKEKTITSLQSKNEFQEALLKQKKIVNYWLAGGTMAALLILLLGYRNYNQQQKLQQQRINELEIEKQLAATEAVLKGEEQERSRLAKDLHDGLGGMLSGIKYSLNTMKGNFIITSKDAQAFERSMDMLDCSIQEMRRVAHNMMPEALVKFGLDTALKDFCNDISKSGALQVAYQSIGMDNDNMPQTTAITIYRIVQELINNSIKHAAAANSIVQITKAGTNITLTVEDDGKGFDTSILNNATGIGWSNIKHRIDFLKGTLDIHSQPDKGTSVLVELNLQP